MPLDFVVAFSLSAHACIGTTDAHMNVLISAIADVSQAISAAVHKGALGGVLGSAGSENVQGETQKKLDIIANDMILDALSATGVVAGMASEELDDCSPVPGHSDRPFLVLFDPLDVRLLAQALAHSVDRSFRRSI